MAKGSRCHVRPATIEDVHFMRGKLRESDRREVAASHGIAADIALESGLRSSLKAWTGFVLDRPFTIFGVHTHSILSPIGCPWLLATDDFEYEGKAIAFHSRYYVREMLKGFLRLENYTDDRHLSAHRWLRWCGFYLEEARPWGFAGLPFRRFWMEAA